MTDPLPIPHRDDGPLSTTAIISYVLVLQFSGCMVGVFAIIFFRIPIEATILTVLGAIITAAVAALTGVGGFWLASSLGSRATDAAMRQLAGAGPPPPADPSVTAADTRATP